MYLCTYVYIHLRERAVRLYMQCQVTTATLLSLWELSIYFFFLIMIANSECQSLSAVAIHYNSFLFRVMLHFLVYYCQIIFLSRNA